MKTGQKLDEAVTDETEVTVEKSNFLGSLLSHTS